MDLEQLALQNGTVLTPDRIEYVGENVVNGVNYPYNKPKTGFAPQYPLNPTTPFSPQ